jgi:hypothetical protein
MDDNGDYGYDRQGYNFPRRRGHFGPHQFAETRAGEMIGGSLIYIAFFNAGLRAVDISNPHRPTEKGFLSPARFRGSFRGAAVCADERCGP